MRYRTAVVVGLVLGFLSSLGQATSASFQDTDRGRVTITVHVPNAEESKPSVMPRKPKAVTSPTPSEKVEEEKKPALPKEVTPTPEEKSTPTPSLTPAPSEQEVAPKESKPEAKESPRETPEPSPTPSNEDKEASDEVAAS